MFIHGLYAFKQKRIAKKRRAYTNWGEEGIYKLFDFTAF